MADDITALRAHLASLPPADGLSLAERRARLDRAEQAFELPAGVALAEQTLGGVPTERLTPQGAQPAEGALLYFHGGGYTIGSPRSHRHLVAALARSAGLVAYAPDYRLAPEHPYPAAVEDALECYRALLSNGAAAERIVVAGDSAGGGLALALLLRARGEALPLPGSIVCLSPWVDLEGRGDSLLAKAAVDPVLKPADVPDNAALYLGTADRRLPEASPLHGDLSGLPPLLIHVGSEEILLDDATRLAARAEADGVATTLEIWPDMIHVWHWFWPMLSEGRRAIEGIGRWLGARS